MHNLYSKVLTIIVALVISLGGSIVILSQKESILDINHNYHLDIFCNYLIALAGVYIVLFFCYHLSLRVNEKKLLYRTLSYIGAYSFFFFPITDYMPGMFRAIFNTDRAVIKAMSYVAGFAIAYAISKLFVYFFSQ